MNLKKLLENKKALDAILELPEEYQQQILAYPAWDKAGTQPQGTLRVGGNKSLYKTMEIPARVSLLGKERNVIRGSRSANFAPEAGFYKPGDPLVRCLVPFDRDDFGSNSNFNFGYEYVSHACHGIANGLDARAAQVSIIKRCLWDHPRDYAIYVKNGSRNLRISDCDIDGSIGSSRCTGIILEGCLGGFGSGNNFCEIRRSVEFQGCEYTKMRDTHSENVETPVIFGDNSRLCYFEGIFDLILDDKDTPERDYVVARFDGGGHHSRKKAHYGNVVKGHLLKTARGSIKPIWIDREGNKQDVPLSPWADKQTEGIDGWTFEIIH